MSENSQNPFSMWMDMNKSMYDAWASQMAQVTGNAPASASGGESANPMGAFYEMWMKNFTQNPMLSMFSGNAANESNPKNFMDQMYQQWQDMMKNMSMFIPNQSLKEGFDRFMNSYQMFTGLQSYWDTFLKNIPMDIPDWNAYAKPIMEAYQNMTGTFMQPFMPEALKNAFSMPMESFSLMQKTFVDFFKPWLEESSEIQGYLVKALQGDKEAYMEFLKAWAEIYKNSLAKVLNAPAVGANRETVEKMMKLLDYYVTFVIRFNEYNVLVSTMMTETMEKLLAHLGELQGQGKLPQTFMEFYKVWSAFNEKAFQDLFVTEAFTKIMNETVSAGSKLKILYDDFMQDMLGFLPLPNRRELDSVEEEVYELRKRVKALEKDLKDLKDAKETKAPSAPRSQSAQAKKTS
ncbi:MAG: hypothetical protein FWG14_04240 [Peptococcaceae bacterium]|nr:hypothetical protein [Peptococcaceae bacterium]